MEMDSKPLHENNDSRPVEGSVIPPIYVVSGSVGALGEQLVRTLLPQFPGTDVPVQIIPKVHHISQIEAVLDQAVQSNGTVVHTLTNADMRQAMIRLAEEKQVVAIDVVGPLIEHLADVLGRIPVGKPGLYHQLQETYFRRVEAIEYTLAHDDGMNFEGWAEAEIVLIGISRVGKTPLSVYLSTLGWKVANVPLVPGVPPRQALFELDRRRVIGLRIDPMVLLSHRKHRQRGLGISRKSAYDDPAKLYEEAEEARKVFRRGGFKTIDVTNKPIETTAGQVVMAVTRQLV